MLVKQHRPRLGREGQRVALGAPAAGVEDRLAARALAVGGARGGGGEVEEEGPGCFRGVVEGYVV